MIKTLTSKQRVELYIEQAYKASRSSNEKIWIECLWSSKIVGNFELGATLSLAERLNIENDSVEDRAHAYKLFQELGTAHNGLYRRTAFAARRCPYIHYSHFRVLAEARKRYGLTIEQVFMYLVEIIQAEGMSVRELEKQLKNKHVGDLTWVWYAGSVLKAVALALQQPDLPDDIREVLAPVFEKLGDQ